MRTIRPRAVLPVFAAVVCVAGCRQADRAISTPPSRAELPDIEAYEPILAINVGVEGAGEVPRVIFVPRFEKVEPTPEERAILGEKAEPPEPDALVFYRPPRGPEHGVSPTSFVMLSGIGVRGGALTGRENVYARVGTFGYGGHYAFPHVLGTRGAQVDLPRSRAAHVGEGWGADVGEGPARTGARALPYRER